MKLTMLALVQIAALPAVHVRAPKRANHPSITCSEPARQRLLEQLENPVAQYRRCRHSGKRARNGRLVSPVIFSRCPCYAEIGPCYFLREISLETLMESAFVDDVAVILAPILRFSPVFSPVIPKNSPVETSSDPTASSATQSGLPELGGDGSIEGTIVIQ
jgi:hypothetical protein